MFEYNDLQLFAPVDGQKRTVTKITLIVLKVLNYACFWLQRNTVILNPAFSCNLQLLRRPTNEFRYRDVLYKGFCLRRTRTHQAPQWYEF